jgi:hypothetical protein
LARRTGSPAAGRGAELARPRAPHDQRTKWAYIFGAICPAKGKGAGLVMPWCDTQAMAEHLKEISLAVDPGCHAVLMLVDLCLAYLPVGTEMKKVIGTSLSAQVATKTKNGTHGGTMAAWPHPGKSVRTGVHLLLLLLAANLIRKGVT